MKRVEIYLSDEEALRLKEIARGYGYLRKPFIENEMRKIIAMGGALGVVPPLNMNLIKTKKQIK